MPPGVGIPVRVSCGTQYTVVVTSSGHVVVFGRNCNGELGLGNTVDVKSPTVVPAFGASSSRACVVAAGFHHTLVLTADGHAAGDRGKAQPSADDGDDDDDGGASPTVRRSGEYSIDVDMPAVVQGQLRLRVAAWNLLRLYCSGANLPTPGSGGIGSSGVPLRQLVDQVIGSAAWWQRSGGAFAVPRLCAMPIPGFPSGGIAALPYPASFYDAAVGWLAVNSSGVTVPAALGIVLHHNQLLSCLAHAAKACPDALRGLASKDTVATLLRLVLEWGGVVPVSVSGVGDGLNVLPPHVLTLRVKLGMSVLRAVLAQCPRDTAIAAMQSLLQSLASSSAASASVWSRVPALTSVAPLVLLLQFIGAATSGVTLTHRVAATGDDQFVLLQRGAPCHLSAVFASEAVACVRLLCSAAGPLQAEALASLTTALSHGNAVAAAVAVLDDSATMPRNAVMSAALSVWALTGALAVLGGHVEPLRVGGYVRVLVAKGEIIGDRGFVVGVDPSASTADGGSDGLLPGCQWVVESAAGNRTSSRHALSVHGTENLLPTYEVPPPLDAIPADVTLTVLRDVVAVSCLPAASPAPAALAGSGFEHASMLITAALQCRATRVLRDLLSLPSVCAAFVQSECMAQLPALLSARQTHMGSLFSSVLANCSVGMMELLWSLAERVAAPLTAVALTSGARSTGTKL